MNLNKEFCASHCTNYDCDLIISNSILRAADSRKIDVKLFDFSCVCGQFEYIEEKKYSETG